MNNLYVDSNREIRYNYNDVKNWKIVRSVNDFKLKIDEAINTRLKIDTISFEHDLSDGNGIQCLEYLIQKSVETGLPFPKIFVHSETPQVYLKFENMCDHYRRKTDKQYVLESRRRY